MSNQRTSKSNSTDKQTDHSKSKQFGLLWRLFKKLLRLSLVLLPIAFAGLYLLYQHYAQDLPNFDQLHRYRPSLISRVYDRNGKEIGAFFKERRTLIPLQDVSPNLINAILSAEDADFYKHQGLDYKGMLRALLNSLKAGKLKGSGSTITQQTVKNILLNQEKSFRRKMKELILTYRLESQSNVSKDDILYLYVNTIYLGHGRFGVEEACQYYFGKSAKDISIAQAAVIAGIIQSPENHSPRKNKDNTLRRKAYVLKEMFENQKISKAEYEAAQKDPIHLIDVPPSYPSTAQWFVQEIKKQLIHFFETEKGLSKEDAEYLLSTGGYEIKTTLDLDLQVQAQAALVKALKDLDQRQKYYQIKKIYTPPQKIKREIEYTEVKKKKTIVKKRVVYEDVPDTGPSVQEIEKWQKQRETWFKKNGGLQNQQEIEGLFKEQTSTHLVFDLGNNRLGHLDIHYLQRIGTLKAGDVLTNLKIKSIQSDQVTLALDLPQGTMVSLNPLTREVLAIVGGSDYDLSPYNRALQAKRQLGSSFKPFLWGAALDQTQQKLNNADHIQGKVYHPAVLLLDSPEVYHIPGSPKWSPKNYDDTFDGEISMSYALAKSKNTVAVRLLQDIGLDQLKAFSQAAGISFANVSDEAYNLTLALGSLEITPLEQCNAFATLGADGKFDQPKWILEVKQGQDVIALPKELIPSPESMAQHLDENVVWVLREMMRAVILEGSGSALKNYPFEIVGKTGTSNESKDTWFMSTAGNLTVGAWIGFDQPKSLNQKTNEAGGKTALPVVKMFLENIQYPVENWRPMPSGVEMRFINPKDGLLLEPSAANGKMVSFLKGSEPKEYSEQQAEGSNEQDFFYGNQEETSNQDASTIAPTDQLIPSSQDPPAKKIKIEDLF
jgi:penicillin-binding protein 1A